MRTRMVLAWFLALAPAVALAQGGEDAAKAQAVTAYTEGRAAFEAGDYPTALARFERAYLLDNAPTLLFNMARAAEEAGLAEKAAEYYELYRVRNPEGEDRPEVERRARVLRAMLSRQMTEGGDAAPPPAAEARADPAPAPAAWRKPVGWGLMGAGVAGIAVGAVFLLDAKSAASDASGLRPVDADRHARLKDDAASSERVAWAGFLLGAAAVGAGVGILSSGGGDGAAPSVSLHAGPGGALVRGRW